MADQDEIDTSEHSTIDDIIAGPLWRPRRPVRVAIAAESDRGLVRTKNQDHYMVARISRALRVELSNLPEGELPGEVEEYGHVMIVADGMGGMAAGEKASMLAIRTAMRLVLDNPRWAMRIDDGEARASVRSACGITSSRSTACSSTRRRSTRSWRGWARR